MAYLKQIKALVYIGILMKLINDIFQRRNLTDLEN